MLILRVVIEPMPRAKRERIPMDIFTPEKFFLKISDINATETTGIHFFKTRLHAIPVFG